jgi:hypothetical protein
MLTFRHKDAEKQSGNVGIRLSCFNPIKKLFYVVDDKMFLSCYNFKKMFD